MRSNKFFIGLLVLIGLLSFVCTICFAANDLQLCKTYTIERGAGASVANTLVANTTITPGVHRIVGFQVIPNVGTNLAYSAGLYDTATNGTQTTSTLFAEEQGTANTTRYKVFAFPRTITNGLLVSQSSNTTVIIEYTR